MRSIVIVSGFMRRMCEADGRAAREVKWGAVSGARGACCGGGWGWELSGGCAVGRARLLARVRACFVGDCDCDWKGEGEGEEPSDHGDKEGKAEELPLLSLDVRDEMDLLLSFIFAFAFTWLLPHDAASCSAYDVDINSSLTSILSASGASVSEKKVVSPSASSCKSSSSSSSYLL